MKIAIADTFYSKFINDIYNQTKLLSKFDYSSQLKVLMDSKFGISDAYSSNLNSLGVESFDVVANCVHLQKAWAIENGIKFNALKFIMPGKIRRLPIAKEYFNQFPDLEEIALMQIKKNKPDIFFSHDLGFFSEKFLLQVRNEVRLMVGQIACPLPSHSLLQNYDLILTSFPHYVDRLKKLGIAAEYFCLGFDERVLGLLFPSVKKKYRSSFYWGD